jgi:hypothetical protein
VTASTMHNPSAGTRAEGDLPMDLTVRTTTEGPEKDRSPRRQWLGASHIREKNPACRRPTRRPAVDLRREFTEFCESKVDLSRT